jgi:hypothetical protein
MLGSYSPKGILYWWGEVYEGMLSVKDYYRKLHHRLAGPHGTKVLRALSTDPSANQVRIELAAMGVVATFPVEKHIDARIIRTTQMMLDGQWKILKGTCPNLEREVNSWEWDEKNPGKPRPGQQCHALDATGYAVLIPVFQESSLSDPLSPPGETPATQKLWRGVRKRFLDQEKERQVDDLSHVLDASPFEEGLTVEEYEFE